MTLNGKQRAALRSMANGIETILQIGKGEINANIIKQADDALRVRELIKCRVLETSSVSARESCEIICAATGAQPVQVIGSRFVLYRHNPDIKGIVL